MFERITSLSTSNKKPFTLLSIIKKYQSFVDENHAKDGIIKIMLHTLSHSLNQIDIHHFLAMISDADVVLLWQDGVTAGIKHTPLSTLLDKKYTIYALDNDFLARGLTHLMDDRIQIINMEACVKLTAENTPQIAW